jgi:hypothetical protein
MNKPRFKAGRWKPVLDLQGYKYIEGVIGCGRCPNCDCFGTIVALRNGKDGICEDCWLCNRLNWNKNGTKVLPKERGFR